MTACGICGTPMTADDRFCGECGAMAPASAEPVVRPEPNQTSVAAAAPAPAQPPEPRSRSTAWPVAAIALAGAAVVLAGGFGAYTWFSGRSADPAGQARPGQDSAQEENATVAGDTSAPQETGGEAPSPDETPDAGPGREAEEKAVQAKQDEVRKADDGLDKTVARAQAAAQGIRDGSWNFTWRINNVTSATGGPTLTPRTSFDIGRSGSEQRCISRAVAQSPRSHAFPMSPRANCRTRSHTMRDGHIDAIFTCNFPNGSRPVEASITGNYTANDVDVIMRFHMPSDMIAQRAFVDEMVDVYYSYRGRRGGTC